MIAYPEDPVTISSAELKRLLSVERDMLHYRDMLRYIEDKQRKSESHMFSINAEFDGEYYHVEHWGIFGKRDAEKLTATARKKEMAVALLFDKISDKLKEQARAQ